MKRLLTCLLLSVAGCVNASNVATITLSFTNTVGQPDTNLVKLIPVGAPILANGGFITRGPAILCYPTTNGIVTTNLSQGNYLATNSFLAQGFLFPVPAGTNSYTIGVNLKPISGFNTYNYTPGVNLITSTNSSVNVIMGPNGVADLSISNISVALAANAVSANNASNFWGVLSITNVPASTNAVNSTNFWGILSATNLPSGLSSSNYVGKFTGDANGLTNFPAGASSTNAVNSTNFWGLLSPTNLPPGLASSNYVGSFTGTGSGITNVPAATNAQISVLATNAMLATNAIGSAYATNGPPSGFSSAAITNSGNLQSSNANVTAVLTASNLVGRAYSDLFTSTNLLVSGIAPTNGSAGKIIGWTASGAVWTNAPLSAATTNTYYASPTGLSANSGLSQQSPWPLQYALNQIQPGWTLLLMDGYYDASTNNPGPNSTFVFSQTAGTPANYMTIKAINKWQAVIGGGTNGGIAASSTAGFRTAGVIFDGLKVANNPGDGIGAWQYSIIRNCWIATNGTQGINISSSLAGSNIVERCVIEWNGTNAGSAGHYHNIYMAGPGNIFRGNIVRYAQTGYGLQIYTSDSGQSNNWDQVYDNLFYGNTNFGYGVISFNYQDTGAGVSPGTNYFYNNTILDGIRVRGGGSVIQNNIILANSLNTTTPINTLGTPNVTVYSDYNLWTNSSGQISAMITPGAHEVFTNTTAAALFVNPAKGLMWLPSTSPARAVGTNYPTGQDWLGNPQAIVSDVGAYQYFPNWPAADTRTLDPSSYPDYWSVQPAFIAQTVPTSTLTAALATNLVPAAVVTNLQGWIIAGAGGQTSMSWQYPNSQGAFNINTNGAVALDNLNGDFLFLYSGAPYASEKLTIGKSAGSIVESDRTSTRIYDGSGNLKLTVATNRVDVSTNLNAWAVNVTNALTVSGTITGTVVSATSATLGSLTTTSQATNQLGLSTFTNTTPLVILETDSKGTVIGASNVLDTQLSGTVALTTNNNLFSGTSNYFGSLTSFGKPVRADSLLTTNGMTNLSLAANALVYVDTGHGIAAVPNGTAGQYLAWGSPPGFSNIQGSQVSGAIASPALASGAQGTNNVFWTDANHSNALFVTGAWITMSNAAGTVQWNGGSQTNSGPIQATQFLGPNGQVVIGGAQQLSAGYAVTSAGATLTASSGTQGGEIIQPTILQSGSGGFAALQVNASIVTTGTGLQDLQEWLNSGSVVARIDINGNQTNSGVIKAPTVYAHLVGNADTATTATSANNAGVSSTLVSGALVTNTVTQILGSSGGQSSTFALYPNANIAWQITTNGAVAIEDLNGNPLFLYLGAPYANEKLTIGKDIGSIMESDRTSTRIYDGSGNLKATIATNQISLATNTAIAGPITYWRNVLSKTANYTVQVADCGSTLNNNGTVNPVTNTLPAAWIGGTYRGTVAVAQSFALKASGSDTIACIGVASSGGGLISSATLRASIDLECQTPGQWTVVGGSTNFWTFQ